MLAAGGPVPIANHQTVVVLDVLDGVVERFAIVADSVQDCVTTGRAIVVRFRWAALPVTIKAGGQLALERCTIRT